MSRRRQPAGPTRQQRLVWQAAGLLLGYPDEAALASAPVVRAALAEGAPAELAAFAPVLDSWRDEPLARLQTAYVELFDLSRKHALYLSYWTDGDTRRRGEALAVIKQRYRRSGFLVNLHGELPDYLPLVLEYAATVDPADGLALLQDYRPSLELLRLALLDDRSTAYAPVLQAVCRTLPGESPADRQAVFALARSGPPGEAVGLDPYDPRIPAAATADRLLPLVEAR